MRLLALVALVVAATACEPPPPVAVSPDGTWEAVTLTADGTDGYVVAGDAAFTTITAPMANKSGNTRIALVARTAPTADQQVCATVAGATGSGYQQGLMLRWDGTRGITITKNVWGGLYTTVNVHTWDTTAQAPFTLVSQHNLTALGWPNPEATPLPWRMCASATGRVVRFKVWPLPGPEPGDDDPCCGGVTTVDLDGPGRPGWYAGHLQPGHTLAYADLTT